MFLLENGFLDPEALRSAVHEGICTLGRRCFDRHIAHPNILPDHTLSPEALGYACRHGTVTAEEAACIRFDHDETLGKYVEKAEDFLEKVLTQITKIATQPDREQSAFHDPCSCHD